LCIVLLFGREAKNPICGALANSPLEHLQGFGKTTPYLNILIKREKSLLQQFDKKTP
jgi:hypothetical protein